MRDLVFGFLIFSAFSITFLSCSNTGDPGGDDVLDQTEFLANIGDNLIVDGYEDFSTHTMELKTQATSFVGDPTIAQLDILRQALFNAQKSWQHVAFYNFGPAEANALLSINFYPTNVDLINQNIMNGPGNYDLSTAGATFAKGFPALDYLLHGYGETGQEIVDKFIGDENARTYLMDVVNNIHSLTNEVTNNWQSYITSFKDNKGTSVGSSLSLLVNAWSQYIEIHVRNAKIGTPNGNSVASSQRLGPFPEKAEAYYSKNSLELLKEANLALRDFYLGKSESGNGVGIHDLLVELNAQNGTLASDYEALFNSVNTKLNAIDTTLEQAIEENGEDITDIFNDYKAIVALLKVDIVSALSISITYTDNDGD